MPIPDYFLSPLKLFPKPSNPQWIQGSQQPGAKAGPAIEGVALRERLGDWESNPQAFTTPTTNYELRTLKPLNHLNASFPAQLHTYLTELVFLDLSAGCHRILVYKKDVFWNFEPGNFSAAETGNLFFG